MDNQKDDDEKQIYPVNISDIDLSKYNSIESSKLRFISDIGSVSYVFDIPFTEDDPLDKSEANEIAAMVWEDLKQRLDDAYDGKVVVTDLSYRYSCLEIIATLGIVLSAVGSTMWFFKSYDDIKTGIKSVLSDVNQFRFNIRGKDYKKGAFIRYDLDNNIHLDEQIKDIDTFNEKPLVLDEIDEYLNISDEKMKLEDKSNDDGDDNQNKD